MRDRVWGEKDGGGRRRGGDDATFISMRRNARVGLCCIARWTKEIAIMHSSRILYLSLSLFSVLVPGNDKFPSHCPVPGTATFSANPSKVPSRGVVRVDRAETIDNPLDDRISRKPNEPPLFLSEAFFFQPFALERRTTWRDDIYLYLISSEYRFEGTNFLSSRIV